MKRKTFLSLLLCLLLVAALLTGCAKKQSEDLQSDEEPTGFPVTLSGGTVSARPDYVVTLSPSLTNALVDLGLSGRITGISNYCTAPDSDRPYTYSYLRCGTAMEPDIDAIFRSKATLVLTPAPLADHYLVKLQQHNIDTVVISSASSLAQVEANYRDLFRAMWGEEEGNRLADVAVAEFEDQIQTIRDHVATAETGLSAAFVGPSLLQIATGDTLIGEVLDLLGLKNWGAEYTGFSFPEERIVELMPDVLFSGMYLPLESIVTSSCYKTTPAVLNGLVMEIPSSDFEEQAPRLARTIWRMGAFLYPEAFPRPTE